MNLRHLIGCITLAILSTLPALAQECDFCAGSVVTEDSSDISGYPLVIAQSPEEAVSLLGSLDAGQRRRATLLIEAESSNLDTIVENLDPILDIARELGPFDGFGVTLPAGEPQVLAFAVKYISATVQGEQLAAAAVFPVSSGAELERIRSGGFPAYIDRLVVPAAILEEAILWTAEHSPATRVGAFSAADRDERAWFLAAELFARGADRAWLRTDSPAGFEVLNRSFPHEASLDPSSTVRVLDRSGAATNRSAISFVRGTDLRTITIPDPPPAAPWIVSIADPTAVRPREISPVAGVRESTDSGRRGTDLLVGIAADGPRALLWDRDLDLGEEVARESLEVAGARTPSVEEIVRRHQAWARQQQASPTRWIARNLTSLRFSITGGERLEASFAGDQFHRASGLTDWAWEELYINGVRWRRSGIPEIPLVQPEKVTRLPLEILLTDDYQYVLAGERIIEGVPTWEVRFTPRSGTRTDAPLYRGTVWLDQKTSAPLRTSRVQLGVAEREILSNEEIIVFSPFRRATSEPLSPAEAHNVAAETLLWLPTTVTAQQVMSVVGRTLPVERRSELSNIRINPPAFEQLLEEKLASDLRMVRDTERGMRYLARDASGERYVKDETDSGQYFMLGGLHHDDSFEYPVVPLGGINYFDFDLMGRGLQTNVFFAGAILSATLTNPAFLGTRTNVGADFFAIALPIENTIDRAGEKIPGETLENRPLVLGLRAGHPFLEFGKIDFGIGFNWQHFGRADDTFDWFTPPTDTLVVTPGIDVRYERSGWVVSAFGEHGMRTAWEPWGIPEEYSEDQKSYQRWGASLGKSFSLPNFQRLGAELNWMSGRDLDRFSKYELGFFGAQRVRGVRSGSVRAEEAILAHLSYGFVFTEQFRLEAYYDHALLTDAIAGWDREPLQGVGISGQVIGPWGTLLRLDLGKTVGRNAQDGFVADILLLKLFNPPWARKNR